MSRIPPKMTPIGQLYKQVEDFKQKLSKLLFQLHHNDKIIELNKYFDKLMLMKQVNVRKPIEILYDYGIHYYKTKILLKDEGFFLGQFDELTDNYGNEIEKEYGVQPKDMFFLTQIKDMWPDLQPAVRANIWKYIWVICFLCEGILGKNELALEKARLQQHGLLK